MKPRSTASETLALVAALALAGCSSEPGDGGGAGHAGSAGSGAGAGSGGQGASGGSGGAAGGLAELLISPIVFTPLADPVADLTQGCDALLNAAPQGGHVLRVGARIVGLDNAPDYFVRITARVRNVDTHAFVTEDSRTVVTAEDPEHPGDRISDRRTDSQFAHAAFCPDYSPIDIVDHPYLLEVEVEELYGDQTTGQASLAVVPRCTRGTPAEQAACRCECQHDYTLGRCGADAGTN